MITDITVTEHTFGNGNDMFSRKEDTMPRPNPRFTSAKEAEAMIGSQVVPPAPAQSIDNIRINLYDGDPVFIYEPFDCYIMQGFLKVVYPDRSYDCWNLQNVESYTVEMV